MAPVREGGGSWGNHGFPHVVRRRERWLIPRALTIAGSDSGGGAGIQADLKAFAAAGAFGMSAIVALTAQNTLGVEAVHPVPPAFVVAQLEAVFADIGVDAAKTGMLFSRQVIDAVAGFLAGHRVPLVVDPVLVASSGAKLLEDDAIETLVSRLFPLASVVTPNLHEARLLPAEHRRATRRGSRSGSSPSARRPRSSRVGTAIPSITSSTGSHVEIAVERHEIAATHGAGCTHSATLAALLARGERLEEPRAALRPPRPKRSGTGSSSSAPATARSTSST